MELVRGVDGGESGLEGGGVMVPLLLAALGVVGVVSGTEEEASSPASEPESSVMWLGLLGQDIGGVGGGEGGARGV